MQRLNDRDLDPKLFHLFIIQPHIVLDAKGKAAMEAEKKISPQRTYILGMGDRK